MRRAQAIRITLLLVAIFGGGVLTGRLTVPRAPVVFTTVTGRSQTAETMLARLTLQVGLDTKQQACMRPILEDVVERMSKVPPGAQERLDFFRSTTPKLRECLRPDQYAAFDRNTRQAERTFERIIRETAGRP